MPPLSPGQLIKLDCDWLQKPKYFLVVAVIEDPLLFYISSEKPRFCQSNPAIDADFLKLTKSAYPFLDYDSWLDCGDVCIKFSWPSIEYQCKSGTCKRYGKVSRDTCTEILHVVGNSERLSTRHQRIIAESLAPDEDIS